MRNYEGEMSQLMQSQNVTNNSSIQQPLKKILTQAIQYMDHTGKSVRMEEEPDMVVVEQEDNTAHELIESRNGSEF